MSHIQFSEDTNNFQTRLITKRETAFERFLIRCGVPKEKTGLAMIGIFIICTTVTLLGVRKTFYPEISDSVPKYIEDFTPEMQKNLPKEVLKRIPSRKGAGENGFTLIELLVVISIIGMLSSVIMVGVASIRQKANNTYTTTQIGQYMRAIQMFVLENNRFPDPSPLSDNTSGETPCLGAEFCIIPADMPSNPKLDAEFLTVMPSLPNVNKQPLVAVPAMPGSSHGIIYECLHDGNEVCRTITLFWVMEGTGQNCTATIPTDILIGYNADDSGGNTTCYVTLQIQ